MKIASITRSPEPCVEAGWYAYNLHLEGGTVDPNLVRALRPLGGSLLFMAHLARPFFKLENHTFIIRGVVGDTFIRVGVHAQGREEQLRHIHDFIADLLRQRAD